MVGGVVIGLTRRGGQAHVNVANCPHYPKHGRGDECPRPDTCCVYCDEINQRTGERVTVGIGDSFWWQSGTCYWTPRGYQSRCTSECDTSCPHSHKEFDIPLGKIGYSH